MKIIFMIIIKMSKINLSGSQDNLSNSVNISDHFN